MAHFSRRKPLGAVGAFLLVGLIAVALLADFIAPYDPISPVGPFLGGPSRAHPLGTDQLGRDMLSRIIFGARPSLYTAAIVVTSAITGGTLLGVFSGYLGGWFDLLIQRIVDGFLALPGLVLAMAVITVLGNQVVHDLPVSVAIALVINSIPGTSRVIRSTTLALKATPYVEAAHAIGCSGTRIVLRHIVPNVMSLVLVIASIQLGGVILAESSLAFLGLGIPPPTPTWGGMLSGQGARFLSVAPWMAIFPGVALSLAVLAFNLFGDALRDVLDPRLRGSGR